MAVGRGKRGVILRRSQDSARTQSHKDLTSLSGSHPSERGDSWPTYSFSRGADGPSTTRLSAGTSFAFFTSRTRRSLGAGRALKTNTKEKQGEPSPGPVQKVALITVSGLGDSGREAIKDHCGREVAQGRQRAYRSNCSQCPSQRQELQQQFCYMPSSGHSLRGPRCGAGLQRWWGMALGPPPPPESSHVERQGLRGRYSQFLPWDLVRL